SHAASFALIAYASAYLKCHYLAAFTPALLNNQPMEIYISFTTVKDAQRRGLRVKPVDITRSEWLCTLETEASPTMWDSWNQKQIPRGLTPPRDDNNDGPAGTLEGALHASLTLRMGFRYAKGLREETTQAIVGARDQRPFESIADLAHRVPELRRNELVLLASIGALNSIGCAAAKDVAEQIDAPRTKQRLHRRDALWQVERAARFAGPLLEGIPEIDTASPLFPMTKEERLVADFHGPGLTVGPHPMAYRRADLKRARVLSAKELTQAAQGRFVR